MYQAQKLQPLKGAGVNNKQKQNVPITAQFRLARPSKPAWG